VLLRWQAPLPCRPQSMSLCQALDSYASSCTDPYAGHWRTLSPAGIAIPHGYAPSWDQLGRGLCGRTGPPRGVERPRRKVRFARLMYRRGRDFGGPSACAAFGSNLNLPSCYAGWYRGSGVVELKRRASGAYKNRLVRQRERLNHKVTLEPANNGARAGSLPLTALGRFQLIILMTSAASSGCSFARAVRAAFSACARPASAVSLPEDPI
jgi:hypothetical protein